jgi:nucleoside-diphosphate-sugar epimerase
VSTLPQLVTSPAPGPPALVVGATGISGTAICELLTSRGEKVLGLSRRPSPVSGVAHIEADLLDRAALTAVLREHRPESVYLTAWVRRATEAENIETNAGIVADVLAALGPGDSVRHVGLMTGLKHYLGPFESYGQGDVPETPFREEQPRLPTPNFYYAQEDALFEAAARYGFTWSVHRSHTIVGHAVGTAMNLALTLAVQATRCRELDRPFVFPGSTQQWNGLTDVTDAGLLAEQMVWAAETPTAANEAFNTVNGDVFRWRWMWPQIAAYFGVEAQGFSEKPRPLEEQMAGVEGEWARIAQRSGLAESDVTRLASWWHTDGDLGREIECVTDMSKSRRFGFTGYRSSLDSFLAQFDRYRTERLIP